MRSGLCSSQNALRDSKKSTLKYPCEPRFVSQVAPLFSIHALSKTWCQSKTMVASVREASTLGRALLLELAAPEAAASALSSALACAPGLGGPSSPLMF